MSDADAAALDAFYDDRFQRERTFRCGDEIVVAGLTLDSPFAHVWGLRDGAPELVRDFPAAEPADGDAPGLSVARAVYEATGRGDQAAVAALLHPEVEWRIPAELPYGGVFHGPAGVMESRGIANEVFVPGQRFTPDRVFQSGDQVVGVGWMEAVVQRTREPVGAPFMHVWTVRDGKVVARRQYTATGTILAALAA